VIGVGFHPEVLWTDWGLVWDNRSLLLHGLWVAFEVSLVALVLSVVIGLIVAVARMGKAPVSWIATIYVNVFRGIPALVSVLWVYFGWSIIFDFNFTTFQAAVVALTLLYSAFISEIYRAALQAIPKGQREAGLALGMHPLRIFMRITLPQATKIAVPNIGSMFIGMLKDTSTFTIIGLVEVVRVTQNINSVNFKPFVLYTAAAIIYVAAAFVIDFLFRGMERVMTTPPAGRAANAVVGRRKRRIDLLVKEMEATSS
jgi:His/Glu/Gln/Arg/opine family amino acid ABC transporter permease subunit